MASSVHEEVVGLDQEKVWDFLKDLEQWAPLMPGYVSHEIISANEMTWVFKGDFGVVKKAVTVQLTVDESVAPEKLAFSLKGVSDNINGGGFYATEAAEGGTKLTGSLNMSAGGFLAGMINPVLEKFLPTMVSELTAAMAAKVQQLEVG